MLEPVSQCHLILRSSRLQFSLWTLSHTTMFCFLLFAVLCASHLAAQEILLENYSFSPAVGGGSGSSFPTNKSNGKITAIRVWEISNNYITGIQLRYDHVWAATVGRQHGPVQELQLFDGEDIIQVSGKFHTNYIYQLILVTSRGRSLIVGRPLYNSFNFYPMHQKSVLLMLSGRFNSAGITSIAAHWGSIKQTHTTHFKFERK